jgi:hypothetical protein
MAVAASEPTRRLLVGAWTGIAMMLAGQVVDLRWHAANGRRFERASDQVGAHWLIWLGVLVLLVVAMIGARRIPSRWYVGFRLLLLAVVGHVLVDGWHFWEHYNLIDPVVPHLLLAILKAVMLAGWSRRCRPRPPASRSGPGTARNGRSNTHDAALPHSTCPEP